MASKRRKGSKGTSGGDHTAILLVALGIGGVMILGLMGIIAFLILAPGGQSAPNSSPYVADNGTGTSLGDSTEGNASAGPVGGQASMPAGYSPPQYTPPTSSDTSPTSYSSPGGHGPGNSVVPPATITPGRFGMTPPASSPSMAHTPGAPASMSSMPSLTNSRPAKNDDAARDFNAQQPPQGKFLMGISTNVFGCELLIADSTTGEVIDRINTGTGQFATRAFDPRKPLKVTAVMGNTQKTVNDVFVLANQKQLVDIQFSADELQAIRKAATCLINIPDGGFGSGFLFQDRRTIATAAHCVVAEKIEDLEFVFDPTEPSEERVKGAKLLHFDRNEDVALLQLPQPMPDHRPILSRGVGKAETGDQVIIVGNPGRDGKPDPTFTRSGAVAGGRVDEFYLDLELKPGFSGGPVCMAASNQAVGVVSYKIVKSQDYSQVGRSYAKSVDLIGDAYEHFMSLSPPSQISRIVRLEQEHDSQYLNALIGEAAVDLYVDSEVYMVICHVVAVDYIKHMAEAEARINPSFPLATQHKIRKAAHEKYLKDEAPKIAKDVRDKVTPRLRMADSNKYDRAMANDRVNRTMKDHLEKAHESYMQLKEAAEKIVQPDRSSGNKGRNLEEFVDWVRELHSDGRFECLTVMALVGVRVVEKE